MLEFFLFLVFAAFLFLFIGIRIVPEDGLYVVERLGAYSRTLEAGLYYICFPVDKIAYRLSKKDQLLSVEVENVVIEVIYQITDAKLYTYSVTKHEEALKILIRNLYKSNEIDIKLAEFLEVWGIKLVHFAIINK